MRSEEKRLRTFRQWPESSPVSATDLAKAGFFFLGPGDRVQCFCCGGILRSWEAEDQPMREHQKFFPTCKFICGEDVGNQRMLPFLEILDYVDGQILSLLQRMDVEETALPSQPEYPEMETEAMRLATFQSWPPYTELYPEQLARAGFFYTDPEGSRELSSLPVDQSSIVQDVLQMGFDHSLVMSLVQSRHLLTGTCYLSVSELVLDLLQVDGEERAELPLSTEEQLRRLQEERMCKVCMDKDVSVVFVPCGHLVVCVECAPSLRRCPICRAVIRGSVRTFMS
ncbi:Baculoviral IAP repeat-containing protein 7-B [Chelonia mydas]|uniref:RING-type E3 ubiquitin transferase n=1 Tax=Chelonia mydas TaxID=8469 RepID=M7C5R7_CHEMY|nr:Baculoviral IAP repeat-containing protein 7-B [Chelonia mydas]